GASGGVVSPGAAPSTVTDTAAASLTLPAASVAVALIVTSPSGSSPGAKVTDHAPLSSVVAVLLSPSAPQVTMTVLPASAVPLTTTLVAAPVASISLSPMTASIIVASGGVVS